MAKKRRGIKDLFKLAEEINKYGSLESHLPPGVVEKIKLKKGLGVEFREPKPIPPEILNAEYF